MLCSENNQLQACSEGRISISLHRHLREGRGCPRGMGWGQKNITKCPRPAGACCLNLHPFRQEPRLSFWVGTTHKSGHPRTGPRGDKDGGVPKMGYEGCPSGECVWTHTQKITISHLSIIIHKLTACKVYCNWVAQEDREKKRSKKHNNRNNPFGC